MLRTLLAALLAVGCGTPNPRVDAVDPTVRCDGRAGGAIVTVHGAALAAVAVSTLTDEPALVLPVVTLERVGDPSGASVSPAATVLPRDHVRWRGPETLELELDPTLGLVGGLFDVVVRTPTGGEARLERALVILDPPRIDAVEPPTVCHEDAAASVRLSGEGFFRADGADPVVSVGGTPASVTEGLGCVPLATEGELCAGLEIAFDATGLPLGDAEVAVTLPEPAACALEAPAWVTVVPPPVIDDLIPDSVCAEGGAITITGSGLVDGTEVTVGGVPAASVTLGEDGSLVVVLADDTPTGLQDVVVGPPGGCQITLEAALRVTARPIVFHVDPPSVPAGTETTIRAWVSDVVAEITDVWLEPSGGGDRIDVVWSWSEADPSAVRVTMPEDLSGDAYDVHVVQSTACPVGEGPGPAVRSELGVDLQGIDPAFGWALGATPVELTAGSPGFEATPAAYVVGPLPETAAHRMLGAEIRGAELMAANVETDLRAGVYDVLVVNPDGALGRLPAAFTVTLDAPPSVDGVSPATLSKSADAVLVVRGRDFRDPTVSLTCLDGGTEIPIATTRTGWTATEITTALDVSILTAAVCVVTVENADHTRVRWSAVSVTNPAQNLFPWRTGTELVVPRRAPAAAAARPTSVARFVYAIGGDDGDESGALDSVERASIGAYGEVGDWLVLPRALPDNRTFAGVARIDRFLYVIGGSDGAGAVDSVVRALVLDPLRVPRLRTLSVGTPDTGGLPAGAWRYRVAAVFAPDFDANPGGESLPSDPIELALPDGVEPTLFWTPVDDVVGYRVYRSAGPGEEPGSERFLADVTDPWFTDDDSVVPDPTREPLPTGALGAWHDVATLTTTRASPCVAVVRDPDPDPETAWIFVAGGADASGDLLDSIEVLGVEIRGPEAQVAGTAARISQRLSSARDRCGAWTVDASAHTVVDFDEAWVYFGGGHTGRGATGDIDAGRVVSGGTLELWQEIEAMRPARAGFAAASASNFLYAFGGHQDGASQSGTSAQVVSAIRPEIDNWNSLGTSLGEPRHMPGIAQESSVIVVIGGSTDTAGATRSTDRTND